jgi:CheY-like chemotaxis protein
MEQAKVVVVDNDSVVMSLIEEVLTVEGYGVLCCSSTIVTPLHIQQAHPDALIVDLRYVDSDKTLSLLNALRHDPHTRDLSITVSSTDERLLQVLDEPLRHLNCATLVKPFDIDQLVECVSRAYVPRSLECGAA